MNGKAPRNEHLNERLHKGEVDPWYAVKKVVWGVFPSSKLYKDKKEKNKYDILLKQLFIKTRYVG